MRGQHLSRLDTRRRYGPFRSIEGSNPSPSARDQEALQNGQIPDPHATPTQYGGRRAFEPASHPREGAAHPLGNHVILNLGGGRYALYAHLKTGSVRVEPGERVRQGQVLGNVGNTGSSTAPHLHFHVMDAPSALASNGLPYVFDQFRFTGRVPNLKQVRESGGSCGSPSAHNRAAKVVPVPEPTRRSGLLPLQADVVDFGD
jgi:murein DD-endopeptidase MepM/ murein hydrolase activator NlpD